MKLPDYPVAGQPITESWGRQVVDCIRAMWPRPGSGIRVIGPSPQGTTYSVAPTKGGASDEQPSLARKKIKALVVEHEDPKDDTSDLILVCRELTVLAVGDLVDFNPIPKVDQTIVEAVAYDEATATFSKTTRVVKVLEAGEATTAPVYVAEGCPS